LAGEAVKVRQIQEFAGMDRAGVSSFSLMKIHEHSVSESGSGIEYFKPNSTSDCDTDSDADCAFSIALIGSPDQAFGSAGGSMTD
jgi:hypothetical protein